MSDRTANPDPPAVPAASDGLLADLDQRGLLHQCTDRERLAARLRRPPILHYSAAEEMRRAPPLTLYCGFDPSADSLHVGHLVPLLTLRRFQQAGCRPIAIAGGGTGMIGDPSGKSEERKLLDLDTLRANLAGITAQLRRFLDFTPGPTQALLLDNYDWLGSLNVAAVLRLGNHISVNEMLGRDSIKSRLERGKGISFAEFSYMILQAYDFLHLFREYGCELQIGGSDQYGNIVAGIDLIRRLEARPAFGLTVPLVKRADGVKFGKTEAGAVWLAPARTSPFEFYQYFVRTDDRDVQQFLFFFTELSAGEIVGTDGVHGLMQDHNPHPERRAAQKRLAFEVTKLVHGEEAAQTVRSQSEQLYAPTSLAALDRGAFECAAAELETVPLPRAQLDGAGTGLLKLLVTLGLASSNGAARRDVQGGAIKLNEARIDDPEKRLTPADLLHDRWLVVAKGKKQIRVVEFR